MSSFQVKLNYEDAQEPSRGSDEAAGYDLYSYESETVVPKQIKLIDTGISIRVPEGTYGRIAPRSSVSKKGILINAGVIDRDYRGPVKVMVHNLSNNDYIYHAGTKYINNVLLNNGGRVLNITSIGNNFKNIRNKILFYIKKINWKYGFYRKDIGWKVIKK